MSVSDEESRIPPVPSPSDADAHTESPALRGFRVFKARASGWVIKARIGFGAGGSTPARTVVSRGM